MARFQNTDITNKDDVETIALKLKQRLEDQVLPVVEVIAPILPLVPLVALIPNLSNISAQVDGTGTDYVLTTSSAAVVFSGVSPSVTLPSAGTYLVFANLSFKDAAGNSELHGKLHNLTDSVDLGTEKSVSVPNAGSARRTNLVLLELVTITSPKTISAFAHNFTGVTGSVESTTTNIQYIKLA